MKGLLFLQARTVRLKQLNYAYGIDLMADVDRWIWRSRRQRRPSRGAWCT